MSVVAESYSPGAEYTPETYADFLRSLQDPDEQLRSITFYGYAQHPSDHNRQEAVSLAQLAAEDNSSMPVCVRLSSLECALRQGYGGVVEELEWTEADYNLRTAQTEPKTYKAAASRYVSETLIKNEGLDTTIWFPPPSDREIDTKIKDEDNNPIYALGYLSALEEELASPNPSLEAQYFKYLIRDTHRQLAACNGFDTVPANVRLEDWRDIHNCSSLLEYGENYRQILTNIYEHGIGAERQYIRLIGEVARRANFFLPLAFPGRYQAGVKAGFRHVLADSLYAVLDHIANGYATDTTLELRNGGRALPLKLHGHEPLELIQALKTTSEALAHVGWAWTHANIRVARSSEFSLLRLVERRSVSNVSVYIRPEGAECFDSQLEYGRPGEGVEASISYVVDTDHTPGTLPEVGKHRGPGDDKRISVRLDREGVHPDLRDTGVKRDPAALEGTLSLDVGSIIGNDQWLSTKLGRFLAHGNVLRTRAASEAAQLNHVVRYFTPADGRADVFAEAAVELAQRFHGREMNLDEVKQSAEFLPKKLDRYFSGLR